VLLKIIRGPVTNSILNHTGLLTFSSIDALLAKFKFVSQEYDIRFAVYKKVLTVMIESLENVCKYTDVYEPFVHKQPEYLPTFDILINSEAIRLVTTNPVRNEDIDLLSKRIELVNNKTRDELKDLYIKTITNGKFSLKGGAGLGFIEMAKTSGRNLQYAFEPINDHYSLYTFTVTFVL
jgi:hypothetical protein